MSPHPILLHDAQCSPHCAACAEHRLRLLRESQDPTFEGGGFGLEPKAKPEITVMIEGVVTCKECRRRMVQTRTLAYSCVALATTDIVKLARDEVNAGGVKTQS